MQRPRPRMAGRGTGVTAWQRGGDMAVTRARGTAGDPVDLARFPAAQEGVIGSGRAGPDRGQTVTPGM